MFKKERLPTLIAILVVLTFYFPLNQLLTGGISVRTALDAYVPIIPVFVIPYVLFLPYWLCFLLYATWKMDDRLFRAFTAAALFAALTASAIFLFYPTYVERPAVTGTDWGSKLLLTLYSGDEAYNAFPSEHTLYTFVIAFFATRWNPRLRWWMAGTVVLVVLATLFTGQHHLVDPVGGLALGAVSCWFGVWFERRRSGAGRGRPGV